MRNFLKEVLAHRKNFIYESLSYTDTNKIQEKVLSTLELNNVNALRDKYDGVTFIETFSMKIFGIFALEKILKTTLIDWNKIDPRDYNPVLKISDNLVDVIISNYGDFPIINKKNTRPAIVAIKKDKKDVVICGYADVEILNKFQNKKYLKGEMIKDYDSKTTFTGFDKLKSFKTFQDLEKLVN